MSPFLPRHLGPNAEETVEMLRLIGFPSVDSLVDDAIPAGIRLRNPLNLPKAKSEMEALSELRAIMSKNKLTRSFIGMGYYDCITPPVIQRNILENPNWYTAYTPYQAEISQGRLEALLNFQTMIIDLTAMEVANASLLDEATACAEAMHVCHSNAKNQSANVFLVSDLCHPQNIAVVQTRAKPLGIEVIVGDHKRFEISQRIFGVLLQYPATDGAIHDYSGLCTEAHKHSALVVCVTDLLALTLIKPPGEFSADVVVGSTQRFGVPLGYGGPHAAFLATRDQYKRSLPGRIIGISRDAAGRPALRMALQTREQHIRREKATSNICTAQVLPAVMASMYAVYHGPEGLKQIAERIHRLTRRFAERVARVGNKPFFDTIRFRSDAALPENITARRYDDGSLGVSFDETTTDADVDELINVFGGGSAQPSPALPLRETRFLTAPVFNRYHTETELLRYIHRLQSRDLSLTTSMIPLGSCTMKLNATAEMMPISWPQVTGLHPFAPGEQAEGYRVLFEQLESWLAEITGFAAVSLQPNAGSQGEYAGLLVIRKHHEQRGESHRDVCLIPVSAHGTNPASATMAGLRVLPVACRDNGDIDLDDLRAEAKDNAEKLACLMVTYPSTHGVFEESIRNVCEIVHERGGQVYMDGANMNAQVGLTRPAEIGADVCHLNLHKTFCIPHGGGGPGMGPIGVAKHLVDFLPGKPRGIGTISAAPWGSASILTISWMYIAMMGGEGLTEASKYAILNANYIAHRLDSKFPVMFKGRSGRVAHECIVDLRTWKTRADITAEDVAKRLIDYGFHAPTMGWPVSGTLMIEPTECESKAEIDRFCDAMLMIYDELDAIDSGRMDRENNPLKNAPHTIETLIREDWKRPYTREQAAYPAPWLRDYKFWPSVSRVDNAYGDRHLICACPSVESYADMNSTDSRERARNDDAAKR